MLKSAAVLVAFGIVLLGVPVRAQCVSFDANARCEPGPNTFSMLKFGPAVAPKPLPKAPQVPSAKVSVSTAMPTVDCKMVRRADPNLDREMVTKPHGVVADTIRVLLVPGCSSHR